MMHSLDQGELISQETNLLNETNAYHWHDISTVVKYIPIYE